MAPRVRFLIGGMLLTVAPILTVQSRRVGAQAPAGTSLMIAVPGYPGPYCLYGIEKRLLELRGVERVQIRWNEALIQVVFDGPAAARANDVRRAVERADYPSRYTVGPG